MAWGEWARLERRHIEGIQIFADGQKSRRDRETDNAETHFRQINSWAICSEELSEMLDRNDAASVDAGEIHPVNAHICCGPRSGAVGMLLQAILCRTADRDLLWAIRGRVEGSVQRNQDLSCWLSKPHDSCDVDISWTEKIPIKRLPVSLWFMILNAPKFFFEATLSTEQNVIQLVLWPLQQIGG
jgi:hypothetical protein